MTEHSISAVNFWGLPFEKKKKKEKSELVRLGFDKFFPGLLGCRSIQVFTGVY
jgi:hypothetical protein